jgi:hypothetical protein
MRKFVAPALAALMVGGPVLALASPAEADGYRRGRHHHRYYKNDNDVAVAAIAGIAGLALGAALADGSRRSGYYSRSYGYQNGYAYNPYHDSYSGGYYRRGYYGDHGYRYRERTCITRERVWDPYIGRHVRIERRYPC